MRANILKPNSVKPMNLPRSIDNPRVKRYA